MDSQLEFYEAKLKTKQDSICKGVKQIRPNLNVRHMAHLGYTGRMFKNEASLVHID